MDIGGVYVDSWILIVSAWALVVLLYLLLRGKKPKDKDAEQPSAVDKAPDDTVLEQPVDPADLQPVEKLPPVEDGLQEGLQDSAERELEAEPEPEPEKPKVPFWKRLRRGARKSGNALTVDLVAGAAIDEDLLEELEMSLLGADLGIEVTQRVIGSLTERLNKKELGNVDAVKAAMKAELMDVLAPVSETLKIPESDSPFVILMVGVNGVGKTTTIGKLAKRYQAAGKSVMLAAGDTFRAAAVEQLKVWGERNEIAVVAQDTGADSASVIFDALSSAKAKGVDIVIADTAGRLHTADNLMEELKKITRVIKKFDESAPHETMIVLDATTGQNGLVQAQQFNEAVGLTGLTLTKLDGTAKGGVVFAIADKLGLPVRYIGVGEAIDDLGVFQAEEFVDALFADGAED